MNNCDSLLLEASIIKTTRNKFALFELLGQLIYQKPNCDQKLQALLMKYYAKQFKSKTFKVQCRFLQEKQRFIDFLNDIESEQYEKYNIDSFCTISNQEIRLVYLDNQLFTNKIDFGDFKESQKTIICKNQDGSFSYAIEKKHKHVLEILNETIDDIMNKRLQQNQTNEQSDDSQIQSDEMMLENLKFKYIEQIKHSDQKQDEYDFKKFQRTFKRNFTADMNMVGVDDEDHQDQCMLANNRQVNYQNGMISGLIHQDFRDNTKLQDQNGNWSSEHQFQRGEKKSATYKAEVKNFQNLMPINSLTIGSANAKTKESSNKISQNIFNNSNFMKISLDQNVRYTGYIQKFNFIKEYGFIRILDIDIDLFFHLNDFQVYVNKQIFQNYYQNKIYVKFSCLKYIGKYQVSYKATQIRLLNP